MIQIKFLSQFNDFKKRLQSYVEKALPGLDNIPVSEITCCVSRLPWGSDGVALWNQGPLFFVAGHNLFKLAPVLGETLVEAIYKQEVPDFL